MIEITVQSRLRKWPLPASAIRVTARVLADRCLLGVTEGEVSICLVSSKRMAQINARYLGHKGPTDVITFDYGAGQGGPPNPWSGSRKKPKLSLHPLNNRVEGEILICPEVASSQSHPFGVGWKREVLRYLAHGFLHLAGHDDQDFARRKVMKRAENALVRSLTARLGPPWV